MAAAARRDQPPSVGEQQILARDARPAVRSADDGRERQRFECGEHEQHEAFEVYLMPLAALNVTHHFGGQDQRRASLPRYLAPLVGENRFGEILAEVFRRRRYSPLLKAGVGERRHPPHSEAPHSQHVAGHEVRQDAVRVSLLPTWRVRQLIELVKPPAPRRRAQPRKEPLRL